MLFVVIFTAVLPNVAVATLILGVVGAAYLDIETELQAVVLSCAPSPVESPLKHLNLIPEIEVCVALNPETVNDHDIVCDDVPDQDELDDFKVFACQLPLTYNPAISDLPVPKNELLEASFPLTFTSNVTDDAVLDLAVTETV